jgi:hypothetical protein
MASEGITITVSDEQLNQMTSDELKVLIKTQQNMIRDQEKRFDTVLRQSVSRPKTAGTKRSSKKDDGDGTFNRDLEIRNTSVHHMKGKQSQLSLKPMRAVPSSSIPQSSHQRSRIKSVGFKASARDARSNDRPSSASKLVSPTPLKSK